MGVHRRWTVLVGILGALLTACGPERMSPQVLGMCRSLGLCDASAREPLSFEVVCDASEGSSCNTRNLDQTLANVLEVAAARPGSTVRLWAQGAELSDTTAVGLVESPAPNRPGTRARRHQADQFVATARAYLAKAAQPLLEAPGRKRSPIAEGISNAALAGSPRGLRRILVVVTDGREVSGFGDFECGSLPTATTFVRSLHREQVLTPGLLSGIEVRMTFVTASPVARRACAVTLARTRQVQGLWEAAMGAAGAASVRFEVGAVRLDDMAAQG